MSQYSLRTKRGLLKASTLAVAVLLSSSSAWAAVQRSTTTNAPSQVRKVSDYSTSYTESNSETIVDNASSAVALNISTRAVNVGYNSTTKPVIHSQVLAYSQSSWNKGQNRVPSATANVVHTFFGQSLPLQVSVDKSNASNLIHEVRQVKQLTQGYRFLSVPFLVLGVYPIEFSVGATGTASSEAFGSAAVTKGSVEKSNYLSRTTLKTSGGLSLYGQLSVGHPNVAAASFTAQFTIVSLTASVDGSTHLAHNSGKDVRRGYTLTGAYSVGSGSGQIIASYRLVEWLFGGLKGAKTLASWPSLASYQKKWADYGILVMSDAGDAW